jgi:D-3-phosphoglycerate dehydrogenase
MTQVHHTTRPRVIIAAKTHAVLTDRLCLAGYELQYLFPDDPRWQEALESATGLVMASGLVIDDDFLRRAPALGWIARLGSGIELIDMKAAEKRGVRIISSPEGNCLAVGEHALGMLLSLLHKISSSHREIIEGKWIRDANRGTELSGKTVGIIGFGHTGRAFADVLKGFNVTILAHDKYLSGFKNGNIKEATKEQVLAESDVISLHLPLTSETMHYANASFFQQAARQPFFLNTSRGEVHQTDALIQALEAKQIHGAALDVLENEKLMTYSAAEKAMLDNLLHRPNVLITPHIAGYSHEAFYKMSRVVAEKLGI